MPNTFQGFPTVPRLPWDDFYFNTWFESLDGIGKGFQGDSEACLNGLAIRLWSGIILDSYYNVWKWPLAPSPVLSWDKKREFRTSVRFASFVDECAVGWVTSGYCDIDHALGFKYLNGKLFAHTSNGSAETNVELVDFGAGPINVTCRLKLVYLPGLSCQFFVNDVLLATITTTLPAGLTYADLPFYLMSGCNKAGSGLDLYCSLISVWQEY